LILKQVYMNKTKVIDREMEKGVASGVFPCADLLIAKDNEIIHHNWYGDARKGTCFDIASLTKPVCTATLTLMLVEEKLLKLDDTVYSWLGGARQSDHKLITVRHLLDHTSGLPAWRPYFQELPLDLIGTEAGKNFIFDSCFNEELLFPPGKKTVYSDIGYILLGEIVEQAGRGLLDEIFANRISKPLKLEDTFFMRSIGSPIRNTKKHTYATADQHVPTPKHGLAGERPKLKKDEHRRFAPTEDCPWRERVVHGEVDDQNAYALGGVAGHAGLFSTAENLHRFINELTLSLYGKSDWLPKAILEESLDFNKVKNRRKKAGQKEEGLFICGWDTPSLHNSSSGRHFSTYSIGHLGYTGCSMWIDLKANYWVILLTNRIHPTTTNEKIKAFRPKLHDLVYDMLKTLPNS